MKTETEIAKENVGNQITPEEALRFYLDCAESIIRTRLMEDNYRI